MVMTEHTYLRETRRSLKLDIKVALLVTYVQEGRPGLTIIKFDKTGMSWYRCGTNQLQGQEFVILQVVMLGTEISDVYP